jgi:L-asparaginase
MIYFTNGTYNLCLQKQEFVNPDRVFKTSRKHLWVNDKLSENKNILIDLLQKIYCDGEDISYLIVGTDYMEEIAFLISLTAPVGKAVVLSGAMRPFGSIDFDGVSNIRDALALGSDFLKGKSGSYVCMSGSLFDGSKVRKTHSSDLNAFEGGRLAKFDGTGWKKIHDISSNSRFYPINNVNLCLEVPILTCALFDSIDFLETAPLDGLIVAGAGTGSISAKSRSFLKKISKFMPVVVSTRCYSGPNYDNFHYKGSFKSYNSDNLILSGFENLNPLQARMLLIIKLSKTVYQ